MHTQDSLFTRLMLTFLLQTENKFVDVSICQVFLLFSTISLVSSGHHLFHNHSNLTKDKVK